MAGGVRRDLGQAVFRRRRVVQVAAEQVDPTHHRVDVRVLEAGDQQPTGQVDHLRTKIRQRVPVDEYLKLQKRFAHLFGKEPDTTRIARIQATADRNIARFGLVGD